MTHPAPDAGVPLLGAVSLPQPPLLVPGLTGRPVAEVEELRQACLAALQRAAAGRPRRIVLIAGRPVDGPSGSRRPDEPPWSVQVGRALLDQAGLSQARLTTPSGAERDLDVVLVDGDTASEACRELGRRIALGLKAGSRALLVVMADGSARRTLKAPGYLDERAEPFDASVTQALAAADWPALGGLDLALADELLSAGARPWLTFAAAMATITATGPADCSPRRHYADGPFGVWYPVFSYRRA